MKPADFEEREYEQPLYNQLAAGEVDLWSPGQVFEEHIGLDHTLFVRDASLFQLHGFRAAFPGAVLSRYRWPRRWFRAGRPGRLPTYRLNLFIQAKRPHWSGSPRTALRAQGIGKPYWRFALDEDQQKTLELVSATLRNRALVVYAAAVFHRHADLFRHTTKRTIVANSTFPSASALAGHEAWIYSQPGAVGVANPDLTPIREKPLEERINALLREGGKGEGPYKQNLAELSNSISTAFEEDGRTDSARRAKYFDEMSIIDSTFRKGPESDGVRSFFKVIAFCEAYMVNWLVIA